MNNIDFASYADDIAPYITGENTKEVTEALENSFKEIMQWVSNNHMKANADKWHLLTNSNEESTICIDNNIIVNSKCEKLLQNWVKANFNAHSNDTYNKTRQKQSAFFRITRYIDIPKRRILHILLSSVTAL